MNLPTQIEIKSVKGRHLYVTPDGEFWGATTYLSEDGSKTNGLVRWAANQEREFIISEAKRIACQGSWASERGAQEFESRLRAALPEARKHESELERTGQIGIDAHNAVKKLANGEQPGLLSVPAALSVDQWKRWWRAVGLEVVATEQPVWSKQHKYGGTIDLIAKNRIGVGVVDYKTRPELYLTDHCQLAAYFFALKDFIQVDWACLVGIPRKEGEKLKVVELGQINSKKRISPQHLLDRFLALKTAWEIAH